MSLVVGVLAQAIARVREHHDHVRDFEPVDQVVEHVLHARVVQVVLAVVHDEQRVQARLAESRRQVDVPVLLVPERAAVELDRLEASLARERVVLGPLGDRVALAVHDRVRAERIARAVGVERVLDPVARALPDDLELVLDARLGRDLEHEIPEVRVRNARADVAGFEAVDPVTHVDRVGLAAEHERAAAAFDERELVSREERGGLLGVRRVRDQVFDREAHQPRISGMSSALISVDSGVDGESGQPSRSTDPSSRRRWIL